MSSAYGSTVNVPTPTVDLNTLLPMYSRLNDADATQTRIVRVDRTHASQLSQLHAMLNHEISSGDTYPQEHEMDVEEWRRYFLSAEAFVVVKGGHDQEPGDEVLGTFYIKPNFPGFIVHKDHRKKGVGGVMARAFLQLAPALGYKASMFNLVFVSNVASIKLWRGLGFQEIGRIPQAGRLRLNGKEEYVDAIMFYKSFVDDTK